MGASTSREAAWGPLLASWAGGESIGAGGLGKNSGRAGPVAEGRLAGGERRCGSSCWVGDSLGSVCGRSCLQGRTWSSYNPGQKVKTRAGKEKDLAGSPGILVDTGGGALIRGPGLLLDTLCHLRSPQARCLF